MRRTIVTTFVALAGTAFMVGCPSSQPGTAGGGTTSSGGASGGTKVAVVTNCVADFWLIAKAGAEKADTELDDVSVRFEMPAQGTPEEQKAIVDGLLADGVKGIAISPKDPANQTTFLDSVADKAILITQDSDAPESKRRVYIGTDNLAAGKQAGELVKEALPEGGKIVLFIGTTDQANAKDRIQGVKDALAGSKIIVVDTRTDNFDQAKAKTNVTEMLSANPDVKAMVGLFAYNPPAIVSALKDAGKLGQIKVVGFDEQDETLQAIKDGHVVGTVVQQPYEFGYQSVKMLSSFLKGESPEIPANKQIIVPTKVIRSADVDAFWSELKKRTGKG
ncbi:MAG: sugar-binding protein [Armatimonadota bacterium]